MSGQHLVVNIILSHYYTHSCCQGCRLWLRHTAAQGWGLVLFAPHTTHQLDDNKNTDTMLECTSKNYNDVLYGEGQGFRIVTK